MNEMPKAAEWLDSTWRRGLEPDPQLTVSEWADRYRVLPPTSAEPGPWRTARVPFLAGVMDALSVSSPFERVVFMKGAQIGGTEAGLNWLGYVIAHAPGVTLLVMPSIDMIRRNSRTRIDPLIETTPQIRRLVAPQKARERGNTLAQKDFPGGTLIMTGANAPTGLRSTPVRYLFLDEIDGYPADADGEGDPVALAIQRTATYRGRRKIFMVSTPTIHGVSRIEKAYAESDQRRFETPCPHCGEPFTIEWRHVRWDNGDPKTAHVICPHGCIIEEAHKTQMLAAGYWTATAEGDGRTAGFHVSGLLTPFEPWSEIVADFLAAKDDPPRLQAWVNTRLGEAWEDRDTAPVFAETLAARAEEWGDALPSAVECITAGVDVQNDRLEVELVAWGPGDESWSVAYEILWGDPAHSEVWQSLDAVLSQRFPTEDDRRLPVAATAIDSGGGRTADVLRYAAARQNRRIWPIKGRGGPGVPAWPKRPPKPQRRRPAPVYIVGVDGLKGTLMARLRVAQAGPGYCHFPLERDANWFAGLVSERPIRRYVRGVAKIEWVLDTGVRNEPLDCRVYAMACREGLSVLFGWTAQQAQSASHTVIRPGWMSRR